MKRLIIPAAVCGLLLAGCTGTGPDDGGSGDKGDKSPLEPYLGHSPLAQGAGMMGPVQATAPELGTDEKNKIRKVEQQIAKCMRDEGFDYVPVSPDDGPRSKFDSAFSLPPEQFARKYGYGISTLTPEEMGVPESDDPNQKIRDELSPKARKAYDKALYGEVAVLSEDGAAAGGKVVVEAGPGGGKARLDGGDLGCSGKASEGVFGGPEQHGDMEKFESLWKDLEALRKRFENNPQVVAATRAWSDCMADAGHSGLDKPQQAQDKVLEKAMPKRGGPDGEEEVRVYEQPKADPELQAFERKIATADYECREQHLKQVSREVGDEMEQQFLDDHRAELERFKETAGKHGVGFG